MHYRMNEEQAPHYQDLATTAMGHGEMSASCLFAGTCSSHCTGCTLRVAGCSVQDDGVAKRKRRLPVPADRLRQTDARRPTDPTVSCLARRWYRRTCSPIAIQASGNPGPGSISDQAG